MTSTCEVYGQIDLNMPSTWVGATYLPPEVLMRSFLRSVIRRYPSASSSPMSPVRKYPSAVNAAAVSSGRLWYPRITGTPRSRISPSASSLHSRSPSAWPTVPGCTWPGRFTNEPVLCRERRRGLPARGPYRRDPPAHAHGPREDAPLQPAAAARVRDDRVVHLLVHPGRRRHDGGPYLPQVLDQLVHPAVDVRGQ